ncbi:hypothetical protein A2U01_0103382, partial [Trifolium medium]|nr:hypothetical protein [Trifolium medium]
MGGRFSMKSLELKHRGTSRPRLVEDRAHPTFHLLLARLGRPLVSNDLKEFIAKISHI